jgi:hypothetical protein
LSSSDKPKRLKFWHVLFWFTIIAIGIKVAIIGAFLMMGLLPHELLFAFFTKLWTLGPTFMLNGLIVSSAGFLIVFLSVWMLMKMSGDCNKPDPAKSMDEFLS